MSQNEQHFIKTAAARLESARLAAGLSLRQLAARAHTSHSTLRAYEKGTKTPSVATYMRILDAAGFATDISISRRISEQNGISRGDELAAVLKLAEQFPSKADKHMSFPVLFRAMAVR